jgi:glycerophosphoryl diester phosphodiesterase
MMIRAIFFYLLLLLTMQLNSQSPMIIAHRGASYDAPENTMAAVRLAWQQDADAVEVDVHHTRDNKIMVIHDRDTRRTAGTRLVVRETPAGELRNLEVGSFKDPKYKNERIPFLEEVIETIPEEKILLIEVKSDASILPFLSEIIRISPKRDRLVVISFDFDVVAGIKQQVPEVPAYWLHSSITGGYREEYIRQALLADLDGLNFHFRGITAEYVRQVHDAGMKMYTWTVDDPGEARRLIEAGIDGITTNRPGWLKEQLGQGE